MKDFAELELPADVLLPTCDFCGAEILGRGDMQAVDEGLKRAYQARLAELIAQSIETLTSEISQQDLERLLGLSRGYISKLKGGKDSTRVIAGLLAVLAADPRSRLAELRGHWEGRSAGAASTLPVVTAAPEPRLVGPATRAPRVGARPNSVLKLVPAA